MVVNRKFEQEECAAFDAMSTGSYRSTVPRTLSSVQSTVETLLVIIAVAFANRNGVADFNKDGRVDIATAMMQQGKNPNIRVFLNEGQGEPWQVQTVAEQSSHSMKVVDVARDGCPSHFGANWNDKPTTIWLWNSRTSR